MESICSHHRCTEPSQNDWCILLAYLFDMYSMFDFRIKNVRGRKNDIKSVILQVRFRLGPCVSLPLDYSVFYILIA